MSVLGVVLDMLKTVAEALGEDLRVRLVFDGECLNETLIRHWPRLESGSAHGRKTAAAVNRTPRRAISHPTSLPVKRHPRNRLHRAKHQPGTLSKI
jgi:hypothetical protein